MKELPPITWTGVGYGVLAAVIGWLLSHVMRVVVRKLLIWRGRSPSSAGVFGRLTGWVLIFLGIGVGLTIAFPSVRPVDVLGGVGVISIAAGIAFQTVLGNMFAGLVLVSRDKFRIGDQVAVEDYSGTIVRIDLTSTTVRTFDGRLLVIPNGVLHSNVLTIQTGYEQVRTTVTVDIDDGCDLELTRRVAVEAMKALPSVLDEPAPDALFSEIGVTTVKLDLRFWSGALQLETRAARHDVITAVLSALRANGILTGSDVHVIEPGPQFSQILSPRDDAPDEGRPV